MYTGLLIYQVLELLCISREVDCCINFRNVSKFSVTAVVALSVVLTVVCCLLINKQRHGRANCFRQPRNKTDLPKGVEAGAIQHHELTMMGKYAVSTESFFWKDRQEIDSNIPAFWGCSSLWQSSPLLWQVTGTTGEPEYFSQSSFLSDC